jgi:hypothetical protein
VVAAVQAAGQLDVLGPVAFDVGVEQIQLHASDVHQPDLGQQWTSPRINADSDRLTVDA